MITKGIFVLFCFLALLETEDFLQLYISDGHAALEIYYNLLNYAC